MTKDDLNLILDNHALWLVDKGGRRADLSNADLSNADLSNAVLRGVDLSNADLSNAVLRNADLRGVDLSNADLSNAVLRNADLRNADLSGVDLSGVDLSGVDLRGAVLSGVDLRGAVLSGAVLSGAKLEKDSTVVGLIARAIRSDGFDFFAWRTDKGDYIKAGCRFFTVDEFRAHVARFYPDTKKAAETLSILKFAEERFEATK